MAAQPQVEQFYTIKQAHTLLGISRAKFFQLLGTDIPRRLVGGAVRVAASDLAAYQASTKEPVLKRGGRAA